MRGSHQVSEPISRRFYKLTIQPNFAWSCRWRAVFPSDPHKRKAVELTDREVAKKTAVTDHDWWEPSDQTAQAARNC
ncbi:MAG: hypothetical protein C5B58_16100 [Acidobacteria bacterium]|nr:MAG: hypothetical protein C5B58_16100 [Acidobacteriota bacterium]